MSNASSTMKPLRFFDLPQELRDMVYEFYFASSNHITEVHFNNSDDIYRRWFCTCVQPHRIHQINKLVPWKPTEGRKISFVRVTIPSALLATCSTLHGEASSFYEKELSRNIVNQIPRIEIHNLCKIETYIFWDIFETIHEVLTYMKKKLPNGHICDDFADVLAEAKRIRIRGPRIFNHKFTLESEEEIVLFAAQTACRMHRRGNRQLGVRSSRGTNEGVSLNKSILKALAKGCHIDARVKDLGIVLG